MPTKAALASAEQAPESNVVGNGVKLVGETFLPGASLLLDGDIGNGLVHSAVGFGARAVLGVTFGPIGMLVVAADSYCKSVTDRNLVDHVVDTVRHAPVARQHESAQPSA